MFIPVHSANRSRSNSHSHLDAIRTEAEEGSTLKAAGRCLSGWLAGYFISCVSSILFFLIGHISPAKPASTAVTWFTAIYGIVFAVIGAAVGASFSRKNALGIGAAIALTIGVVAMWSWYETPDHSHWTHLIAIFLIAPAAQFGSLTRRLTD